jgi:hypothetical protein
MATYFEQVAAQRGYPSDLFGLMPNDADYWREPLLPWAPQLPLVRTIVGDQLYQVEDYAEFVFITNDMAPRFPVGTLVTIEPVLTREALHVGRVYVHLHPTEDDELQVGRLAHVEDDTLHLTQDNNPLGLRWPLGVHQPEETADIYEVTYYGELPTHWPELAGAGGAGPMLLEMTTDDMGPRYPQGSRHVLRSVPAHRRAQARGVHALALADGTQLVRRILDHHDGLFTLDTDRAGAVQQLPLMQIVSLWKLTLADYMPEETEAEHLAIIQRRTC